MLLRSFPVMLALATLCSAGCGKSAESTAPSPSTCTAGAKQSCGNCGSTVCDATGQWGTCSDEGPCAKGQSVSCVGDGTMACDDQCQWAACTSPCTAGQLADCGNCGTMTCDPTGKWALCTDGPCKVGAIHPCSACSARTCEATFDQETSRRVSCEWSDCVSNCSAGNECNAGTCTSCGTLGGSCCNGGICDNDLPCSEAGTCSSEDQDSGLPPDQDADVPPEDGGPDGSAPTCTFAPRSAALILFYGAMADGDGWRDDLHFKLANPKLDVVFTVGGGSKFTQGQPKSVGDPGSGEFLAFHQHCIRIARHMSIGQLVACLNQRDDFVQDSDPVTNPCASYKVAGSTGPEDFAAFVKGSIDLGWDYIAVDEVKNLALHVKGSSNTHTTDLRNGAGDSKLFISSLNKIAALGDTYDKRLIMFFVPHNASVCTTPPPYDTYTNFFTACREHCRTIMHELYFTTTEIEGGMAKNFNCVAEALHATGVTDINRVTTAIIAVGNDKSVDWAPFDDPPCDLSPWPSISATCTKMNGSGGLVRQLNAIHASSSASRYWWGVGFYKTGAVLNNSTYTRTDFIESTASRVNWWATHAKP